MSKTYDFIKAFGAFLEAVGPEEVLRICLSLFSSERILEIFLEFYGHGELDVHHLVDQHGYSDASVYRAFSRLEELDLIKEVYKRQKSHRGGQRTGVWSLKSD